MRALFDRPGYSSFFAVAFLWTAASTGSELWVRAVAAFLAGIWAGAAVGSVVERRRELSPRPLTSASDINVPGRRRSGTAARGPGAARGARAE